jgi:hypothetical protein
VSATRRTSLIAGILFALTFVASIPALPLYDSIANDTDYVLGAGYDIRVAFGALGQIVTAIAGIGTAVVLFPVLGRQNEAVALGRRAARVRAPATRADPDGR